MGSRLLIAEGPAGQLVARFAARYRVDRVVAQRSCLPSARAVELRVQRALELPLELFEGQTLHRLGTLRTRGGAPFSVFTAFSRAFFNQPQFTTPLAPPRRLPPLPRASRAPGEAVFSLSTLGLEPNAQLLPGGETAAHARLDSFLEGPGARYHALRDRLDLAGTSRLSVDLCAGTLSIKTLWSRATRALENRSPEALRAFLNELVWREFSHATLWEHPNLLEEPFQARWKQFPWQKNEAGWRAWVEGTTGYPVVDAAARQLLAEGFVHNRARMIAASFLCKHLLIDFRRGEAHYLRFLTDANPAQNDLGWQWSAGCGCDAQPYFRVFNPISQGERFDPTGQYVRTWVPELSRLPDRYLHQPWLAPPKVLAEAGVRLGHNYPLPVVEHSFARGRFLALAKRHLASARRID